MALSLKSKKKRFGDERDNEDYRGSRSSMPPRQRDGKPYPGGRPMRRALKRLAVAQAKVAGTGKDKVGTPSYTVPGAMNH